MSAASRKQFFGPHFQWGVISQWDSVLDWPEQDQATNGGGRLVFRLELTPREFTLLNSAIINGLEIFDLPEYSLALDRWINDTNATEQEPVPMNMPIGCIIQYAGAATEPPAGFLVCDGRQVAQADFPELFGLLGTTYGTASPGNFTLPNFNARFPMGATSANNQQLGNIGGRDQITLTVEQMPNHSHTVTTIQSVGTGPFGIATARGSTPTGGVITVGTGNSQPVGLRNPYLAVNFIIRALP